MNLDGVLARAFEKAPAMEANVAMARLRGEHAFGGKEALSYEMVLDPKQTVESLAEKVLPKLVYFLDCRGLKLEAARGVFVSLFVGDALYFLHASDFVDEVAKAAGLSLDELVRRYGAASV